MSCYPILYFERKTVAVILCGGKSTRMGTDKGLKDTGEGVWVKRIEDLCKQLHLDVLISVNKTQIQAYEKLFSTEQLIEDKYENIGPLSGVLSAYDRLLEHDILFLSCDMQLMTAELLLEYLKNYDFLGEYDIVASEHEGFHQPFPSLYSSEALHKLSILYLSGNLTNYSFQQVSLRMNVFNVSLSDQIKKQLKSLNSNKDL